MPEYVTPNLCFRARILCTARSVRTSPSQARFSLQVNYRVYTPAGMKRWRICSDLVTDGQDYANPGMGALVNVLDSLIAGKRIKPVIGVFIDHVTQPLATNVASKN